MKTLSINCSQCGKEFQKSIYDINKGHKHGQLNHFCSNQCSTLYNRILQQTYKQKRIDNYYKNPKKCLGCSLDIPFDKKNDNKYCSHSCASTHNQKDGGHVQWTEEGKQKLREYAKDNPYFNGKIKMGSVKRGHYKICPHCHNQFYRHQKSNQTCCSVSCSANYGILGGFRIHSGTSKKGWYKGYFCGSSWELAWLIYQLDNNIKVERNKKGFEYTFDGKVRKYYPDFIVNGEYIEIKNYETAQVREKTKQFPHKLKLLYGEDLKDIFAYVEGKYGKDFIKLYEKK